MKRNLPPIILASGSRRRSALLSMCRIPHEVVVSRIREVSGRAGLEARDVVLENAARKAADVVSRTKRGIVIGADTVVFLGGRVIGKLRTRAQVKATLARLSRGVSYVYTGLAVIDASTGKRATGVVKTRIRMKRIAGKDLDRWLEHIGPYDKAGGFSIEGPGSVLFPRIEGCYFNIVGLPMSRLSDLVGKLGYNLLDYMAKLKTQKIKGKTKS